jgi:hypothetical protein
VWYFRPTRWLPVKLLLAAYLLWCLGFSIFYSGLRAYAAIRVIWAIPAAVHFLLALLVFGSTALFVVGLELAPIGFFAWQVVAIPMLWNDRRFSIGLKVGYSAILLVAGYFIAFSAAWLGLVVVSWIADINPCAALAAGVTGSKPPLTCP